MENNMSDVITPPLTASNISMGPPEKSAFFYIKIIFIVLFLALMGLNIFTYLSEGTDIFGKYLGISLLQGAEGTKRTISNTKKGSEIVLNAAEDSTNKLIDIPEQGIRNKLSNTKTVSGSFKVSPSSNKTKTNVGSNKKGYCYIGSENGNRKCIKVDEDDICESRKIFPTRDVCINPYLR